MSYMIKNKGIVEEIFIYYQEFLGNQDFHDTALILEANGMAFRETSITLNTHIDIFGLCIFIDKTIAVYVACNDNKLEKLCKYGKLY